MSKPRTCLRTGCRWPAAASLSFRYASRQVWVADPTEEAEPSRYDLCRSHADALTVPRGWERIDERAAAPPPFQPVPASEDLDREVSSAADEGNAPSTAAPARSRYAGLLADLPHVAAAYRDAEARRKAGKGGGGAVEGAGEDHWRTWTRELLEGETIPQAEGQLAMPVDEHGIVVPLKLAGARRRSERTPTG